MFSFAAVPLSSHKIFLGITNIGGAFAHSLSTPKVTSVLWSKCTLQQQQGGGGGGAGGVGGGGGK
jgi:hypothetical protein